MCVLRQWQDLGDLEEPLEPGTRDSQGLASEPAADLARGVYCRLRSVGAADGTATARLLCCLLDAHGFCMVEVDATRETARVLHHPEDVSFGCQQCWSYHVDPVCQHYNSAARVGICNATGLESRRVSREKELHIAKASLLQMPRCLKSQ